MDYTRIKQLEQKQYALLGMFQEANMRATLLRRKITRFKLEPWSPEKDAFDPQAEASKIRADIAKYREEFDSIEVELREMLAEVQSGHIS